MMRALLVSLMLVAPAHAQDTIAISPLDNGAQGQLIILPEGNSQGRLVTSPIDGSSILIPDVRANEVHTVSGGGAVLKGLDKVSGQVTDLKLRIGDAGQVGRIEVSVGDCRYPEDNAAGEGYAWLTITDPARNSVLFEGWMIASSPALNALDHPRYDVWVIRCTTA